MATTRQVKPDALWRVAHTTLGPMACVYGDPSRDEHDHDTCLRDDESYAADLLLALVASVVKRDDTAALDNLTDLGDAVAR